MPTVISNAPAAPANVAVGIARLGGDSAFIGRVGQDSFGAFLQRVLSDEGVDIGHMRPDPEHHTSTVVVDLDLQGERSFTFMVQPSADLFLQPDDLPAFQRGEWLHLCSIALAGAQPQRGLYGDGTHSGGRRPGQFRSQHPRRGLAPAEALRPCLQRRCCWRTW